MKEETIMKEFVYSYPMKVYFGEGAARKVIAAELGRFGKTVMLAYGGGSIKKSGVYDEMRSLLTEAGKEIVDFSGDHAESYICEGKGRCSSLIPAIS